MNIAILASGFLPVVDGVTITLLHRLRRLSQLGHRVLLLCPDYRPLQSLYPNWADYTGDFLPGVTVVNLASTPFMGVEFERNVSGPSYRHCLQALTQFQPDLIQVDEPDRLFLGFGKIPAVDYAKAHDIPCLSFYHTHFLEYLDDYVPLPRPFVWLIRELCKRWITRRTFNAYDLTLVSSRLTYEKVVHIGLRNAHYGEFLGVDLAAFSPDLRSDRFFATHYGLAGVDARLKLIMVGRLTPDKGWKVAIPALRQLAQRVDPASFSLIVVGDGELRQAIASGLGDTVDLHLLGRVPPQAIPALMVNSDLHFTASEKETRGLTVLEAFAAGIPVVAPQAGGVVDSIQPERTGLFYPPGQVADCVTQLQRLIESPDLRHRLGQQGREWVQSYSWDSAVDRLVALWEDQIKRSRL